MPSDFLNGEILISLFEIEVIKNSLIFLKMKNSFLYCDMQKLTC